LNQIENFSATYSGCSRIAAMLVFNFTGFESPLANCDAVRHTDELPVSKHGAGTLTAVIQDHIHARGQQLAIEFLGCRFDSRKSLRTDRAQHHGKGRQRVGPDDAALVMVLLNGGSRQARDANAVATHFHELRLAVDIQKSRIHGLAVFGAQIEHMADLNATLNRQHALAIG